jgi:nicotinic acid mononucleotide adenylyltransferase
MNKTIVMGFGRMNPVSSGHALLANAILKLAQQNRADHVIFLSRTQDAKKNPLSVDQKVKYARAAFPGANIVGANDRIRTFIEAAKSLSGRYANLIMVAGSDRVTEYQTLLEKYNGKDFTFKSIKVVSAGERDPDADNAIYY